LPLARRRRAGRCHQGQVHADLGAAALGRAAVGPGRPAGAQHHHHLLAQRHARRELPGHQLLRGPDLRGPHQGQGRGKVDLADATICVAAGSTEEKTAADWFRERNLKVTIINFQKNDDAISAYDQGRCDAYTAGIGALAGQRIKFKDPEHQILTEIISNDPQGR
jgi:ABC-type amino acid transport/signal transduction systems, periplasmic component/domain